jgi:hypothetical protein
MYELKRPARSLSARQDQRTDMALLAGTSSLGWPSRWYHTTLHLASANPEQIKHTPCLASGNTGKLFEVLERERLSWSDADDAWFTLILAEDRRAEAGYEVSDSAS